MHNASFIENRFRPRTWKRLSALRLIKKDNSTTAKDASSVASDRLSTAKLFLFSWFGA
jgi:hypothetical protein